MTVARERKASSYSVRAVQKGEVGLAEVELVDVTVRQRNFCLLDRLSFSLETGLTALLGRNGAGKTTAMRAIVGVQKPSSGRVNVDGADIFAQRSAMIRHKLNLGWVPQAPGYPPRMTSKNFVEYAAWLRRISRTDRADAVDEAMIGCSVQSISARPIGGLSGGERQRVILAAAIVGRPKTLLLDEPTVGLDPAQREEYLRLLSRLSHDTIVLYSTHLVDDVVRTADRVLVMDTGALSRDFDALYLSQPEDVVANDLRQAVINSSDRNS